MFDKTTVLVVGAGPTGLLLAAELLRRNVNCRLIDAHEAPLHWDRATVVHPRSLELFEGLGILDPLLSAGVKQRIARIHAQGVVLGEIDLSDCGSRYGFNIGISEEVTESILTQYLHRHDGTVLRASSLVGLTDNAAGILATIQRTTPERKTTTEQVLAQWVVGCDGLHSTCRALSGIDMRGHDIVQPWAVFDATLQGWQDSYEANYAYLDEIPVILTALPGRRWRVYLRPSSPTSDLVADASSTIGRYLPACGFDGIENPARFQCHTKIATRFRSGRVLLAGDAAHVCSPAQGHGMNTGLQDAVNLAWKLALVCHGVCDPVLLDSYEAERQPVAELVTASGDAVEQAQMLTDPAARQARDETLRAVFADANSRHHEAVAEAELDIDYAGSPIVMGDRHQALAPGQRLPDTIKVCLADGGSCMLHELTNRAGHTALLVGPMLDAAALLHIENLIRAQGLVSAIIEELVVIGGSFTGSYPHAQIAPAMAAQLGIERICLFIVRPDGHIGLRSDSDPVAALTQYRQLLMAK